MSGILALAGFNVINHGNFSSVVEGKPGEVIKLFNLQDIGYQHLLEYSDRTKCDNMFQVFSFTKSGNYGIVEMECLQHKDHEAVKISEYIDRCRNDPITTKHKWGEPFRDIILDLDQSIRQYNVKNGSSLTWDNHEHNILFRGKVPVLVDVVYGEA